MPDKSRVILGFAFLTPTGRPVRSHDKKVRALWRFFRSEGTENDVEGVHVIARWANPDDRSERSRRFKTTDEVNQSLEDFYETMSGPLFGLVEPKARRDYDEYLSRKRVFYRKRKFGKRLKKKFQRFGRNVPDESLDSSARGGMDQYRESTRDVSFDFDSPRSKAFSALRKKIGKRKKKRKTAKRKR